MVGSRQLLLSAYCGSHYAGNDLYPGSVHHFGGRQFHARAHARQNAGGRKGFDYEFWRGGSMVPINSFRRRDSLSRRLRRGNHGRRSTLGIAETRRQNAVGSRQLLLSAFCLLRFSLCRQRLTFKFRSPLRRPAISRSRTRSAKRRRVQRL